MDITNMTSTYTDIYSNSAQMAKLETTVKSNPSTMKDEELMDACKQFEAYFLEQVFKEMQKTVHRNDDSSQNSLMEYFEDRYVQKIAEDSTETNSLGLAQMLYEQMRHNYGMDPSGINPSEMDRQAVESGAAANTEDKTVTEGAE